MLTGFSGSLFILKQTWMRKSSALDWLRGLWTGSTAQHPASKSLRLELSCQHFCLMNPAGELPDDGLDQRFLSSRLWKPVSGNIYTGNDLLQIHSLINEDDRGTDRQSNIFFLILILKQQREFRIHFPSFFFWLWSCLCSVIALTLSFLWLCLDFSPPDLAVCVCSFLLSALWPRLWKVSLILTLHI